LTGENESAGVKEIAVLAAGGLEDRDEVGIPLSAMRGAEAAGALAIDDAITKRLFRGIVGGRAIGALQEDQSTGLMVSVTRVEALAVGIVGILTKDVLEFLVNEGYLSREMRHQLLT
jgi:hypothetical protein